MIANRTGPGLMLLLALVAGCEPQDRRPGLWVSGEVADTPAESWAFTDDIDEIFVETRTWYGIPHSVTTVVVAHDGTLYVPSLYRDGGEFPEPKYWNRNVASDPNVRLKIGDTLYEREAHLVTDPEERQAALAAFAEKYPFWDDMLEQPAAERPKIVLLRMDPRDPGEDPPLTASSGGSV